MKDKERVAEYLGTFLHCCAYLGYSNFDVHKLTQVFRRIYKKPEAVDMRTLLDYFVVLALSKSYYKDFDEKSVQFVEAGITLIEKRFTGQETLETKVVNEVSG